MPCSPGVIGHYSGQTKDWLAIVLSPSFLLDGPRHWDYTVVTTTTRLQFDWFDIIWLPCNTIWLPFHIEQQYSFSWTAVKLKSNHCHHLDSKKYIRKIQGLFQSFEVRLWFDHRLSRDRLSMCHNYCSNFWCRTLGRQELTSAMGKLHNHSHPSLQPPSSDDISPYGQDQSISKPDRWSARKGAPGHTNRSKPPCPLPMPSVYTTQTAGYVQAPCSRVGDEYGSSFIRHASLAP